MIQAVNITGISYDVDSNTKKYVEKRVKQLEKYIPKHARDSVSVDVKLSEVNHDNGNKYLVEMIFTLPGKVLTAKDTTGNVMAAVDIVEAKIKVQLLEYKRETIPHIGRRSVMSRFKRGYEREL